MTHSFKVSEVYLILSGTTVRKIPEVKLTFSGQKLIFTFFTHARLPNVIKSQYRFFQVDH